MRAGADLILPFTADLLRLLLPQAGDILPGPAADPVAVLPQGPAILPDQGLSA